MVYCTRAYYTQFSRMMRNEAKSEIHELLIVQVNHVATVEADADEEAEEASVVPPRRKQARKTVRRNAKPAMPDRAPEPAGPVAGDLAFAVGDWVEVHGLTSDAGSKLDAGLLVDWRDMMTYFLRTELPVTLDT